MFPTTILSTFIKITRKLKIYRIKKLLIGYPLVEKDEENQNRFGRMGTDYMGEKEYDRRRWKDHKLKGKKTVSLGSGCM